MVSDLACRDIIHVAHHAAGDPALWDEVVAGLAEQLKASAVAFVDYNATVGHGDIAHATGIPPNFRRLYAARFSTQNVWLDPRRDFSAGDIFTGAELVPNWELARTTFYRDWLRPQRLHHCLVAILCQDGGLVRGLIALRPLGRSPFDAADKRSLGALLPELRCAYELGTRFAASHSRADMMREVMQALPQAIFLVDRDGYPSFANRAAERLLAQGDGLAIVSGMLSAGAQTRELRHLVHAAVAGCGERPQAEGQVLPEKQMLLGRPSGAPPLIVRIKALSPSSIDESGRSSAAVLVLVQPIDSLDAIRHLSGYYRMTPAEARLAALILKGRSLLAAASELRISKNTARTHMKRIYLKTETHRQVDLVRLLTSAAPPPDDALPRQWP
jgi:DNA-binding CsgD family transcriptional regulator/PAS domain-containing protein